MTVMTKPTVKNLTEAERLVLARRRKGLSGPDLARRLKMRRHDLQNMELGARPIEGDGVRALVRSVTTASVPELCFIARRRADLDTSKVADEVGVSRQWVCMMERGHADPTKLASYWGL